MRARELCPSSTSVVEAEKYPWLFFFLFFYYVQIHTETGCGIHTYISFASWCVCVGRMTNTILPLCMLPSVRESRMAATLPSLSSVLLRELPAHGIDFLSRLYSQPLSYSSLSFSLLFLTISSYAAPAYLTLTRTLFMLPSLTSYTYDQSRRQHISSLFFLSFSFFSSFIST